MRPHITPNSTLAINLGGLASVSEIWVSKATEPRHAIMTLRPAEKVIFRLFMIAILVIGSGFRSVIFSFTTTLHIFSSSIIMAIITSISQITWF